MLTINLSLIYMFVNLELASLVCSSQTFIFEQLQKGLRRSGSNKLNHYHKITIGNREAYPDDLPRTTISPDMLLSPYQNIYQGARKPNDTRVYRRRFQYDAQETGHRVFLQGEFNCLISHLAAEATHGIPILLRGGVGYQYFIVVAKARPGQKLEGLVRAYCLNHHDEYYKEQKMYATL